jgi:hypothetical protein
MRKEPETTDILFTIENEMSDAESRAWECLSKGSYSAFARFASKWNDLNSISAVRKPNPFRKLVDIARSVRV